MSRVLSHQSSWVARKLFPRIRNWRVASRVGLRLALQACWGTDLSDTGRMKRSLRVIAVQSAGRERREKKRFAANTRRLLQFYYLPSARVQQCCTVPGRIIDCPALVRCAYDSRSRLRVGLLQALAWSRTPHSQRRTCTASASNAVRRCARKKETGLRRGALAGGHCWTVGRTKDGECLKIAQPCGMRSSGQAW